ncbi:hypothetical protein HYR99_41210 [Candidatus Poribacteria bacterium]|nr:hypothetical protein [Candidatus Poribacteria bacterium]
MKNWFGDHLRKVHVLFVSPEWASSRCTKFDAKEYIDRLSAAGVETVEFYINKAPSFSLTPLITVRWRASFVASSRKVTPSGRIFRCQRAKG